MPVKTTTESNLAAVRVRTTTDPFALVATPHHPASVCHIFVQMCREAGDQYLLTSVGFEGPCIYIRERKREKERERVSTLIGMCRLNHIIEFKL